MRIYLGGMMALGVLATMAVCFGSGDVWADEAFSALDLAKAADANRLRFDKQFKNKEFDIKGTVFKAEEGNGKYVVYLHGAANKNPFRSIACEFDPEYEDAVMEMDAGKTVTVHCAYMGKQPFEMGALTLMNCQPR